MAEEPHIVKNTTLLAGYGLASPTMNTAGLACGVDAEFH